MHLCRLEEAIVTSIFLLLLAKNINNVTSFSVSLVPDDSRCFNRISTKRSNANGIIDQNHKAKILTYQTIRIPASFKLHLASSNFEEITRRESVTRAFNVIAFGTTANILCLEASASAPIESLDGTSQRYQNFVYNNEWTGTALPLLSPTQASSFSQGCYDMGRWPDPILRRPASRIPISLLLDGNSQNINMHSIANRLRKTARENKAVGLAAEQCGIDVSMIFLDDEKYLASERRREQRRQVDNNAWNDKGGLFLVNPRIIARSSELEMQVWDEKCLVLPPSFTATVLRDSEIQVQYETLEGQTKLKLLKGEMARALQHELDHDRGILILDHVSLEELKAESQTMMDMEEYDHNQRQLLAYDRFIDESTELSTILNIAKKNEVQRTSLSTENSFFNTIKNSIVPPAANAIENENIDTNSSIQLQKSRDICDKECQERRRKTIEERRAMMKQSRSTGRAEVFELSKQRAALYGTAYKGIPSCPPNVPCI